MKHTLKRFIFLVLISLIVIPSFNVKADENYIDTVVPDKNFQQYIISSLGYTKASEVKQEDLAEMTTLIIGGVGSMHNNALLDVTDFTGIELMNIENLIIENLDNVDTKRLANFNFEPLVQNLIFIDMKGNEFEKGVDLQILAPFFKSPHEIQIRLSANISNVDVNLNEFNYKQIEISTKDWGIIFTDGTYLEFNDNIDPSNINVSDVLIDLENNQEVAYSFDEDSQYDNDTGNPTNKFDFNLKEDIEYDHLLGHQYSTNEYVFDWGSGNVYDIGNLHFNLDRNYINLYVNYAELYVEENTYTVLYTDGVEDEEIFVDQSTIVKEGDKTPAFSGTLTREGHVFEGWSPIPAEIVTEDAVYVAQWKAIDESDHIEPVEKEKQTLPATGVSNNDLGSISLAFGCLFVCLGMILNKQQKSR